MDNSQNQDMDSSPPTTPMPVYTPPKSPWYKRKWFWIPVILILVAAAAAAGYAYYASLDKPQPAAQHKAEVKPPVAYEPQALVYVTSAEKLEQICMQQTNTVHYLKLGDQADTNALEIDDYQSIADFATYHDLVVIATTPSCASKKGSSLWLSKDSGASYQRVYSADTLGRISSVAFSTDGSEVAFGFLSPQANDAPFHAVKSLNVASNEVRDLFTSDQIEETSKYQQMFDVRFYDKQKQRVYYIDDCYACDRATPTYLRLFDLTTGKTGMIINHTNGTPGTMPAINHDGSKALRAEYPYSEGSQTVEYKVSEFDLITGKRTLSVTHTASTPVSSKQAGYMAEGTAYFTVNQKFMIIGEDGKVSDLAEVPSGVSAVFYISSSRIIYGTGNQPGGEVIDYDIKSKKPTQVLKYKYPTIPYGVSVRAK